MGYMSVKEFSEKYPIGNHPLKTWNEQLKRLRDRGSLRQFVHWRYRAIEDGTFTRPVMEFDERMTLNAVYKSETYFSQRVFSIHSEAIREITGPKQAITQAKPDSGAGAGET